MPAADLLPPEAYSWWVPALGLLLLAAVGGWLAWVHRSTDPRRRPARQPEHPGAGLRARYTAQVDSLHAAYRDGALDLRGLHLELGRTMREFASERLGTDVRSWTRADVAGHDPTRRVGHLLARWEEPSFAPDSDAEATTSTTRAKEVIGTW
ncbi:hypothetical protein [Georgenia yuyongxinii]|uniref:DUF4381 family protein n=1 Tax=Georgenia yuyongxinii TaxID=2589797 RepID=A0A552WVU4_9MICO|nr:hypothetical protein [Georgenia yuyongxinii]TRW46958.1 hypothetical protein FJ693_02960 [Georgenia yuyongxinii]